MSRQPLDFQTLLDESHDGIEAAQEVCDLLKLRADESGDLDQMAAWASLTAQLQSARFRVGQCGAATPLACWFARGVAAGSGVAPRAQPPTHRGQVIPQTVGV